MLLIDRFPRAYRSVATRRTVNFTKTHRHLVDINYLAVFCALTRPTIHSCHAFDQESMPLSRPFACAPADTAGVNALALAKSTIPLFDRHTTYPYRA